MNVGQAQQARQLVVSSNAYALAENEAPAAEILQSLTDSDRAAIPAAALEVQGRLRPASMQELENIAVALGRQIGLIRIGLSEEAKDEWISLQLDDLREFPADMVLEALRSARRHVKFEGEVLPAVLDTVEPQVSRLKNEARHLERLAAVLNEQG